MHLSVSKLTVDLIALCVIGSLFLIHAQPTAKEENYLRRYVNELKQITSKESLLKISEMPKSQLIELHFTYGMWIRNKWLLGNRNDSLVAYFKSKGINDPDDMSMELIKELWTDLNNELSPENKIAIEEKRKIRLEKMDIINKLCDEGTNYLRKNKKLFLKCYNKHGKPSKNPSDIDPFYYMIINCKGNVDSVAYSEGASETLKSCLNKILLVLKFTPFKYFDTLSLYVIEYPYCNVNERGRY